MRVYETKQISYEKKDLPITKCDLCGVAAKQGWFAYSEWEVNETELRVCVRQKNVHSYPKGGWGTKYEADICPDCFKNKLIPWLESQGCKTKEEEWGW